MDNKTIIRQLAAQRAKYKINPRPGIEREVPWMIPAWGGAVTRDNPQGAIEVEPRITAVRDHRAPRPKPSFFQKLKNVYKPVQRETDVGFAGAAMTKMTAPKFLVPSKTTGLTKLVIPAKPPTGAGRGFGGLTGKWSTPTSKIPGTGTHPGPGFMMPKLTSTPAIKNVVIKALGGTGQGKVIAVKAVSIVAAARSGNDGAKAKVAEIASKAAAGNATAKKTLEVLKSANMGIKATKTIAAAKSGNVKAIKKVNQIKNLASNGHETAKKALTVLAKVESVVVEDSEDTSNMITAEEDAIVVETMKSYPATAWAKWG